MECVPSCVESIVVCSGNLMSSPPCGDVVQEIKQTLEKTIQGKYFDVKEDASSKEFEWQSCEQHQVISSPPPSPPSLIAQPVCVFVDKKLEQAKPDERDSLQVTIKLFTASALSSSSIDGAIHSVLKFLKVQWIDNLVISFSSLDDSSVETWKLLETYVKIGSIKKIGLVATDFSCLKHFWGLVSIKPDSIHLDVRSQSSQGVEDFLSFGKENQVELMANNDPVDLLKVVDVQSSLKKIELIEKEQVLSNEWLIRYTFLIKCRNILCNRGYIYGASRAK